VYVERVAEGTLRDLARQFRAVVIAGPRQSGKTTLARRVFPAKPYVSFEDPDTREFAVQDPRRFLLQHERGAVFDEVQRCPEILSYLQGVIDASAERGRFVLTGSQHLGLTEKISQSLAGRVGILNLMPFSLDEIRAARRATADLDRVLWQGGYPQIHDGRTSPVRWYNAYVSTYIERDIRQLVHVHSADRFQRFMRLCAGSVGQLVNLTRLGADCGVDQKTAAGWLTVLEAGFIVYRLRPHHANFRKRLVKTPKMYFYDTGLAARLLGVESAQQLAAHHMRGALFENWVVSELLKARSNRAEDDNLYFWRNNTGHEVDLIVDRAGALLPIEIKSGMTIASDWFDGLARWCELAGARALEPILIYGGKKRQSRETAEVVPWSEIGEIAG
jgi:uncharacterized protein